MSKKPETDYAEPEAINPDYAISYEPEQETQDDDE